MALLNRFFKLNDRGETGVFTFIVTKSVTRDFHRDATTKDFCFGFHRWAVSFQRPSERVLGVHLLLRNPSPSTACLVDFTLTLVNRHHFSLNKVFTKRQAKFTITNSMQGVSRWIQVSELVERRFTNEAGEFLFELALSNMSTVFECDIQLATSQLSQYRAQLGQPPGHNPNSLASSSGSSHAHSHSRHNQHQQHHRDSTHHDAGSSLISLETNYFTFGSFDWSLTILPLAIPATSNTQTATTTTVDNGSGGAATSVAASNDNNSARQQNGNQAGACEPVCRVYLNRLTGLESICRVKYRVILGHHQQAANAATTTPSATAASSPDFADSRLLDQISDFNGRIRGYQFRNTNILKLIALRQSQQQQSGPSCSSSASAASTSGAHAQPSGSVDLRVHIEMYCANTVSEARVHLQRKPNDPQTSNCVDRNKQSWCVECDSSEQERLRLKLFFLDAQSVPRNHVRYISWSAYVIVCRDKQLQNQNTGSGGQPQLQAPSTASNQQLRESVPVRNGPHCNLYMQDGIDMGTIMDTDITTRELSDRASRAAFLNENNELTIHIEWMDSLLLFSHLYSAYDSLGSVQLHQIRRELSAQHHELSMLETRYLQSKRLLEQLLQQTTCLLGSPPSAARPTTAAQQQHRHQQHSEAQVAQFETQRAQVQKFLANDPFDDSCANSRGSDRSDCNDTATAAPNNNRARFEDGPTAAATASAAPDYSGPRSLNALGAAGDLDSLADDGDDGDDDDASGGGAELFGDNSRFVARGAENTGKFNATATVMASGRPELAMGPRQLEDEPGKLDYVSGARPVQMSLEATSAAGLLAPNRHSTRTQSQSPVQLRFQQQRAAGFFQVIAQSAALTPHRSQSFHAQHQHAMQTPANFAIDQTQHHFEATPILSQSESQPQPVDFLLQHHQQQQQQFHYFSQQQQHRQQPGSARSLSSGPLSRLDKHHQSLIYHPSVSMNQDQQQRHSVRRPPAHSAAGLATLQPMSRAERVQLSSSTPPEVLSPMYGNTDSVSQCTTPDQQHSEAAVGISVEFFNGQWASQSLREPRGVASARSQVGPSIRRRILPKSPHSGSPTKHASHSQRHPSDLNANNSPTQQQSNNLSLRQHSQRPLSPFNPGEESNYITRNKFIAANTSNSDPTRGPPLDSSFLVRGVDNLALMPRHSLGNTQFLNPGLDAASLASIPLLDNMNRLGGGTSSLQPDEFATSPTSPDSGGSLPGDSFVQDPYLGYVSPMRASTQNYVTGQQLDLSQQATSCRDTSPTLPAPSAADTPNFQNNNLESLL